MVMKQTLKMLKRFYHHPPRSQENQKKINVISKQETSDTSKPSETDDNFMLNVIQEEEFSESSECEHFSEFEDMICDSSDKD